ncbi:MAG: hypothetical protein OEM98_05220, partial [Gammaproteobacteria bacterium]|nr:hypothetical protein [Gammaproteobacteria bacterium]
MGQLVEPRRGLPDNLAMLRLVEGTLSHCLPGNVLAMFIENAALHRSATSTFSVIKSSPNMRRDVNYLSLKPLMFE